MLYISFNYRELHRLKEAVFAPHVVNAGFNDLACPKAGFLSNLDSSGLDPSVQQNPQVLTAGNQIVLDLLALQSPPSRPSKVMVVDGIREAALHQVMASAPIASPLLAQGLAASPIDQFLPEDPFECSALFGSGALVA